MNIQMNQIITIMYISHQTLEFSQIQVLAHRPIPDPTGIDATGRYSTEPIRPIQSSTIGVWCGCQRRFSIPMMAGAAISSYFTLQREIVPH